MKLLHKNFNSHSFIAMAAVSFCVLGFSSVNSASSDLDSSAIQGAQSKSRVKIVLNPESIEGEYAELSFNEIRSIFRDKKAAFKEPMLMIDWSDLQDFEFLEKEFSTPEA